MLERLLVVLYFTFGVSFVVAQSSPVTIVCVAGQCLQGSANITLGATLSSPGAPSLHLLPGQYTSTTNPQLLHNILTSSSATLSSSPGFNSSSLSSLPLNIALQPGLAIYSNPSYAGQAAFSQLPSTPLVNSSIPLPASSLAISNNVWVAVTSGSSNNRVIFWDAIPDVSQLPPEASQSLTLTNIQSSTCSPPCSGSGVCSASGTCSCPTGFTGSSCETCAQGFFGPTCKPCPAGCQTCDQGISGSGRCLVPVVSNAPSTCNCLNGQCGSNGQCACNPGWTNAANGTACAQCAPGFFLTSTGDCEVCQLGCSQCTDGTAVCISCKQGFTQDASDKTKCDPLPSVTSGGTTCPAGAFSAGQQCSPCSPSCSTCNGPSSNNCIVCAAGQSLFNGSCVAITSSTGVCQGTNGMIANNNKQECDTCGAKCTSCEIPNFSVASTVSQLKCTGCLPGFFLSQGQCVESCPSGTFVSPQDNLTCTACSSSCGACLGSADFCLTCTSQQLASSGQCVSTCPSGTFSSSGACLKCHPDCASCSGPSFNQCSTCPPNLPVLTSGRCLPTCSQSQFFDETSSSCEACDSSCSSCSASGPSHCLSCSSSTQVLRAGSCVSASCNGSSDVIPGLGICLSDLVQVSTASASIPSATGLTDPTVINTNSPHSLAWWEILLMALGCAFIFVVILMLWRRRARKQRAKQTAMFASAKRLDGGNGWRWRLEQLKKRLFGKKIPAYNTEVLPLAYHDDPHRYDVSSHSRNPVSPSRDHRLKKLRDMEDKSTNRHTVDDLDNFIGRYENTIHSRSSRTPSVLSSIDDHYPIHNRRRIERDSLYSEVTGNQRHTPEPRQPLRRDASGTSKLVKNPVLIDFETREEKMVPPSLPLRNDHPITTEAQAYAMSVRPGLITVNSNAAAAQPTTMPSTFATTPMLLTPAPPLIGQTQGQGSYWLTPVVNTHPIGGPQQQLHPAASSLNTVVLQPMNTGGSSRNPFRQGAF